MIIFKVHYSFHDDHDHDDDDHDHDHDDDDDHDEEDALYIDMSLLGVNIIPLTVVHWVTDFTSQMMCKVKLQFGYERL